MFQEYRNRKSLCLRNLFSLNYEFYKLLQGNNGCLCQMSYAN